MYTMSGKPVKEAALFLASDDFSFMMGIAFRVDGGIAYL